jgi:signal transduction histidine kinase
VNQPFFQILVRQEGDVILARHRTRRVAALAGLSLNDQTRLTTAVSEVVRNAYQYAGPCSIRFGLLEQDGRPLLGVTVTDKGPGMADVEWAMEKCPPALGGAGGLAGARRLVDHFVVESAPGRGTSVTLAKLLPAGVDAGQAAAWGELLARESADSPLEEVGRQNRDLLRTLEELRQKEMELAGQLGEADRLNRELEQTNEELDRTNKGVISLYKEIEDKNVDLLHEVRERQAAEEKLARSNRELEHFAYIASHDLQEPLRMIGSFLQLLSLEYEDKLDADGKEYIHFAVDGARRMQELISDLLTYSRVDMKGKPFLPTDMEAVLDAVLGDLRHAIEESGAVVTRDPLPTLRADALQMMQLFQNLIKNAIKFRGQAPPAVHVGGTQEADGWTFSVRDNGIGIEPRYWEKIFVIFQRLHTRDEYPGTGIGLAVCQRIVERHGGRIWLESQAGAGTTFFFTLPHDPPHESGAEPGEGAIV